MPGNLQLVIFAGPNGSGKSTLKEAFTRAGRPLGTYINADDITTELYQAAIADGEYVRREEFELDAFWEADRRRRACIASRQSFSFETVFSHYSKVDLIQEAKAAGYFVVLHFVSTENSALNVARVRVRVAKGGHNVPEDKIVSRYHRSMEHLPRACMHVDEAAIYDNSGKEMRLVATVLRRDDRPQFKFSAPLPAWVLRWANRMVALIKQSRGAD